MNAIRRSGFTAPDTSLDSGLLEQPLHFIFRSGITIDPAVSKNKLGSAKSRWKQMKKGSMKKLTNLTNRLNLNQGSGPASHQRVPNHGEVVSTAPDGRISGVLPRIQASKSMQNLEQVPYLVLLRALSRLIEPGRMIRI